MACRKEQLIAFEKEVMRERLGQTLEYLDKEYQNRKKETDAHFLNELNRLFEKTVLMQNKGIKDAVSYLCISPLRCSAVTGENDLLIALYDCTWYLDISPVYGYWKPTIIFQRIDEDIRFFASKAHKQFVRLEEFEILQVKMDYLNNFYILLQCFCANMINEILKCPFFFKMETSSDFSILFGEYMEGMAKVYPLEEAGIC